MVALIRYCSILEVLELELSTLSDDERFIQCPNDRFPFNRIRERGTDIGFASTSTQIQIHFVMLYDALVFWPISATRSSQTHPLLYS